SQKQANEKYGNKFLFFTPSTNEVSGYNRTEVMTDLIVVKFGVNRFGYIGHLVTGASFISGKVAIIAIRIPFININYMIYMFQYDYTHSKIHSTVKAENQKLVTNGKVSTIFQDQDEMLMLSMLWSLLVSSARTQEQKRGLQLLRSPCPNLASDTEHHPSVSIPD
ncbi:glyceraldehyde-3-phosphate dehydrogenase, partial [Cricetulus griseus]